MAPLPAGAVREIEFNLEGVEGKEWGMVGLSLRMGLNMEGGRGFTLKLARLTLPPPLNQLQGLELDCPKGKIGLELITCLGGTLKLGGGFHLSASGWDYRGDSAGVGLCRGTFAGRADW